MGMIRIIIVACLALFLFGCCSFNSGSCGGCCGNQATTMSQPSSLTPPADDAGVELAEAATSISESLTDLTAMEKAVSPPINCKAMPYPSCSDMYQPVSIDWSGPIEPLLLRLACVGDYKLRILGRRPAIPVLVTIYAKNTPLGYIIRDANFQAASKASVAVYSCMKIIELRYGRT